MNHTHLFEEAAQAADTVRVQLRTNTEVMERLGYLRDGRAIELSQSIYRGDTYDFVAELNAS